MKAGIASLLLGLAGLVLLTYYYFQATEGLGLEMLHRTMSEQVRIGLFILEAAGVALGYFSYRRRNSKVGLLGMGLCALCLILLNYPF